MKMMIKLPILFFSLTTSIVVVFFSSLYINDFTRWVCAWSQQQSDMFDWACHIIKIDGLYYFIYGLLLASLFCLLITYIGGGSVDFNNKIHTVKKRLFMRSSYYLLVYIISVSIMSLTFMILIFLLHIDLMLDDLYKIMNKEYGWYSGEVYDSNPLFDDFFLFVHTLLPLSVCYAVSSKLKETFL